MLKKVIALAILAAFAFMPQDAAAQTKKRRIIRNNPTVYSTQPNLPADVPYTNRRNRDWLGGYLGNNFDDGEFDESNDNNQDSFTTSPRRHRNWRDRRRR